MNDKKVQVEFIESYIKIGNSDYQWNDNHGELIRCKNCMHGELESWNKSQQNYKCLKSEYEGCYDYHEGEWFCADGERSVK